MSQSHLRSLSHFLKQNKEIMCLLLILLLAAFLRFYHLGSMPINIHVDEVMNGYVGRFILQNGVDLYGNPWPVLYFNNFGDYPNVLPMYLSGLSTYVFGLTELALRFPIALFGVVGVLLLYLISKEIFKDRAVALFIALSLTIMPWHLVLSRATAEGITASTVFLFAFFLQIRALKQQKNWLLLPSTLLFLLTYFLYPSYRVIVPLIFLPWIILLPQKNKKIIFAALSLLFLALTVLISQTTWGQGRFSQTNFFTAIKPWQTTLIAEEGHNNALKARILFNKPVFFLKELLGQYGNYFGPNFLFAKGGLPMRYAVPLSGVWYYSYLLMALVFVVVFVVSLQQQKLAAYHKIIFKDQFAIKIFLTSICLLLLSPLAASLTVDDVPNVHRAALMAPYLLIVMGYIFSWLNMLRIKKLSLLAILLLPVLLESVYFLNMYFVHSNSYQLVYRSSEMKNLAFFLKANEDRYDRLFIEKNGPAAVYYLFFNNIFDKNLSQQFQLGLNLPEWKSIRFTADECVSPDNISENLSDKRSLFIVKPHCFTEYNPTILQRHGSLKKITDIPSLGSETVRLLTVYELPATASAERMP